MTRNFSDRSRNVSVIVNPYPNENTQFRRLDWRFQRQERWSRAPGRGPGPWLTYSAWGNPYSRRLRFSKSSEATPPPVPTTPSGRRPPTPPWVSEFVAGIRMGEKMESESYDESSDEEKEDKKAKIKTEAEDDDCVILAVIKKE